MAKLLTQSTGLVGVPDQRLRDAGTDFSGAIKEQQHAIADAVSPDRCVTLEQTTLCDRELD